MLRYKTTLFAFLTIVTSQCQAHSSAPVPDTKQCAFTEVVNRSGWQIPGLRTAQLKLAHAKYPTDGDQQVFYDVLKPIRPAAALVLLYCERGSTGRIELRNQPADVTGLSRFVANDRVFAYLVIAHPVEVTKKGKRLAIASEERLYYYDPDGAGRFTMMKYAGDLMFRIVIPDWVKQSHGVNLSIAPDTCESSMNSSDPVRAANATLRKSPYAANHDRDCVRPANPGNNR